MRSKLNALLLILLLGAGGCMSPKLITQNATQATEEILNKQVLSWNKGDLNGFMEGYWKSDSLQFIGKNGVTYGYEKTLENYRQAYPNAEAMGKLSYDILSVKTLHSDLAYVTGKWKLDRSAGNLDGYFTLLLRRMPEGWRIISDHSS